MNEKTDPAGGLTEAEVARSRAEHGTNVLTPPKREPLWRKFLARFGDIHDIQVDGLTTRALSAVHTDDGVRNLTVRNVRLFGDAGSVWTGGTFGLDIAPFIYLPAREGEVRRSTLTPGKMEEWGVPRTDTVRLENVLFDGVTVEATPHDGEALFRFRCAELVNCRVRNLRAPAGRKMCDGDPRGTPAFEAVWSAAGR